MKAFSYTAMILGTSLMVLGACTVLLLHWSAFGWKALSIPTGSMRPTMPPGTLVVEHRVPDSTLHVGDIITYTNPLNPKTTISHRIIKEYVTSSHVLTFITKGDANKSADVPVVSGLVEGQVVWHIRNVGEWLMWSKSLLGIALLVYVPALFITVEEVQRLNDYYARSQPYKLHGYTSWFSVTKQHQTHPKLAAGVSLSLAALLLLSIASPSVGALLGSNTVSLVNHLSVAAKTNAQCSGTTNNNTSINVTNTNTQNASSGNVKSTGGTASSGSATNNSTTGIGITVTNC